MAVITDVKIDLALLRIIIFRQSLSYCGISNSSIALYNNKIRPTIINIIIIIITIIIIINIWIGLNSLY
jgi:hypothetical protein